MLSLGQMQSPVQRITSCNGIRHVTFTVNVDAITFPPPNGGLACRMTARFECFFCEHDATRGEAFAAGLGGEVKRLFKEGGYLRV
jgi:hypothetical protein